MASPEHGGFNPEANKESSIVDKMKERLQQVRDHLSGKNVKRGKAYDATLDAWYACEDVYKGGVDNETLDPQLVAEAKTAITKAIELSKEYLPLANSDSSKDSIDREGMTADIQVLEAELQKLDTVPEKNK